MRSGKGFMKPRIPLGDNIREIAGGVEKMPLNAVVHTQPKRRPLTTPNGTKNEGNSESAHKTGVPKCTERDVLNKLEVLLPMQLAGGAVSGPLPHEIIELQNGCLFLQHR